jgi:uncharacterized radical SAM superfamily protein
MFIGSFEYLTMRGNMVENLRELITASRRLSWTHFGKRITFYAPSFAYYKNVHVSTLPLTFPSISITGRGCALKCKHCNGKVLHTMIPAMTPQELLAVCRRVKETGGQGCLISGGCLSNGSVPIKNFIGAIQQIKQDLALTLVVHTGVVDKEIATELAGAGVDAVLLDIIGSQETIEDIYNLQLAVDDYETSLQVLSEAGLPFVPHVLVGLHYGRLLGEINALEMIAKHQPQGVVIIALTPLKGTAMEDVLPPSAEDIAWVLAKARILMPQTPLSLGCMRPKGSHRKKTDVLAVQAGVNAIAFPEEAAIALAESMGLEIQFSTTCCSQIYEDLKR